MEDPKKKEAPKCNLKWEDDHFVLECDTPEDRDQAAKTLEREELVVKVKVKVKKEGEDQS